MHRLLFIHFGKAFCLGTNGIIIKPNAGEIVVEQL